MNLIWLLSDSNPKEVKKLLDAGVDINTTDGQLSALHICVILKRIDTLIFLIKNGANVNLKNNDGLLPLHVINTITLPEIVELLIIHGTDLHSKSKNNKSVLNKIIENNLLNKGNIKEELENRFYQDYEDFMFNIQRVEILKNRPEFPNNTTVFDDIKDEILKYLNSDIQKSKIEENLKLLGLKVNKYRIKEIEEKIEKSLLVKKINSMDLQNSPSISSGYTAPHNLPKL